MSSLSMQSIVCLCLLVLFAVASVPTVASPIGPASRSPTALLKRAGNKGPAQRKDYSRAPSWKRSRTHAPSSEPLKFVRAPSYKKKRASLVLDFGNMVRSGRPLNAKRAVGGVPDSGPMAADSSHQSHVLEKRAVGGVDISGATAAVQSERRLVGRGMQRTSTLQQAEKMGRPHAW
ncbi:secreted protein [Melampsora americana]|nr:secreted protein [Melampsora americana]